MSIQVVWDDAEQSIVRWDFEPEWDWNDFWEAFAESIRIGEGYSKRVDVIPNVTNTKRLPIGALGAFKSVDTKLPDFVNLVVVAGSDSITRMVIKTFAQINRIDSWRTATTVDEARAIIAADRQMHPT
ncbi:MAG: hypothetical protein GC179_02120 [Anaerolineaceae bacterium]|nr:hypothetical protein [Anaerolineaceae bacterium]